MELVARVSLPCHVLVVAGDRHAVAAAPEPRLADIGSDVKIGIHRPAHPRTAHLRPRLRMAGGGRERSQSHKDSRDEPAYAVSHECLPDGLALEAAAVGSPLNRAT